MAAKNKFLNAMKMPSIDDMFSSEADRQRESGDLVTEVPLSELHPFVGHPFEVRDDEDTDAKRTPVPKATKNVGTTTTEYGNGVTTTRKTAATPNGSKTAHTM